MPGLGRAIQKYFRWDTDQEGYTRHFIYESQLRYDGPTFHTLCDMTIGREFSTRDFVSKEDAIECRKCVKRARAHNDSH